MRISMSGVTIAGLTVYWYGLLIALAILLGLIYTSRREKAFGFGEGTVLDIALIAVPCAVVCARLYFVIFSWDDYRDDLLRVFDIRGGGLAIYGGLIGAFLAVAACAKRKKLSLPKLADLAVPAVAFGQALGRWGNFFNREAYGYEARFLKFFPFAVDIGGVPHIAAFFYESAWCFIVFLFLHLCRKKNAFRRTGDAAAWYALLYGAERTLVEGVRTDSLYIGPLRVSMLLSACACVAVSVWFAHRAGGRAKYAAPACGAAAAFLAIGGRLLWALPVSVAFIILSALNYFSVPRPEDQKTSMSTEEKHDQ